jgi:hypothetical protein
LRTLGARTDYDWRRLSISGGSTPDNPIRTPSNLLTPPLIYDRHQYNAKSAQNIRRESILFCVSGEGLWPETGLTAMLHQLNRSLNLDFWIERHCLVVSIPVSYTRDLWFISWPRGRLS